MPIYLIIAYIIFCLTPVSLAFSIAARRRRVEQEIAALESSTEDTVSNEKIMLPKGHRSPE